MIGGGGTALPILRAGDGAVARQGGRIISWANFLAEIEELAERLPDRPHVVNFCSDRYRFTVAWFAAMLRGQVTLLPGSRDAAALAELRPDFNALYVLTDEDEAESLPGPCVAFPALDRTVGSGRVPAFPADQIAAVLFTSGSTGRPNPSARRWGRLVAGSHAAGAALGVDHYRGSALIATVPHAHSYGLESAVMLPLQHGLVLTSERPFFPADVAAALSGNGLPGVLVTTPVHLRALVGDAGAPASGMSFRAAFVLSATAPLSAQLAERTEAAFSAPVLEIYGCSEAGQLATRRTTEGPVWRTLRDFRIYNDAAGSWAAGPDEPDVLLADEIEPVQGNLFILKGRTADLVNVAGKRSSLAYLTSQLTAIDGVQDGVFLMPDDGTAGATARLIAVALAPGLTAATVLDRLRERIDAAFMPRPLHLVDTMPRNALGKLPRAEILRLARREVHKRFDGIDTGVILRFAADHPAFAGHFPGNPIVPGAVLLDQLMGAVFPGGWCGQVEAAKFHLPLRPGDAVVVSHKTEGGSTRFECRLPGTLQLVLSGVLRTSSPSQ